MGTPTNKVERLLNAWSKYFEVLDKMLASKNLEALTTAEKFTIASECEAEMDKVAKSRDLKEISALSLKLPAIAFGVVKRLRNV